MKLAIEGVSGSGKTYSALRLARGLVGPAGKIAVIDTENGSASLYSDQFDFDVVNVAPPFRKNQFITPILGAVEAGYHCLIIDSASHIWEGVLDLKDRLDKGGGNHYTNWNSAGNVYKDVINTILQAPIHVLCCMRSKVAYVIEENDKGSQVPRKVGMAPIIRDGTEYEFSTVFDLDRTHLATIDKDRTKLFDDDEAFLITEKTGESIAAWLRGMPTPEPEPDFIDDPTEIHYEENEENW